MHWRGGWLELKPEDAISEQGWIYPSRDIISKAMFRHGIWRAINVNLSTGGKPSGALEADSEVGGNFTEHDIDFLASRVHFRKSRPKAAFQLASSGWRSTMLISCSAKT